MVFNEATALTRFYRPASGRSQLLLEDNGRPALELADWKNRIRTDWPGVSIGVLDCIDSRCAHDETVPLRVEVTMNGLTESDVRVECLVNPNVSAVSSPQEMMSSCWTRRASRRVKPCSVPACAHLIPACRRYACGFILTIRDLPIGSRWGPCSGHDRPWQRHRACSESASSDRVW